MAVPFTFGSATAAIPLSQLDSNFATTITLGNTAIQLGNTVTTLNNMTLANVTISSGNVTLTNVAVANANVTTSLTLSGGTANGVAYLNTSKVVTTGSALVFDGSRLITGYTSSVGTAYQTNVQVKGSSTSNYGGYGVISSNNEMLGFMGVWSNGENSLWISADPDNLRASSNIVFSVDGTERMRLDSSGNLLVGITSGTNKFMVGDGTRDMCINPNSTLDAIFLGTVTSKPLVFGTGNAERARIDSDGNLLVGTTSKPTTNFYGLAVKSSTSSASDWGFWAENSSSNAALRVRNDGYVNSLSTYSLTGGTANLSIDSSGYITRATSSIRYKRDVETYDKGLSIVLAARPVYYKSSVADADGNVPETQFAGLIAEELDALGLNEFVEYNQEGQPDAVRYGNMVSLCIKAIQELNAKFEAYKATHP
jgi:hypothetical protein